MMFTFILTPMVKKESDLSIYEISISEDSFEKAYAYAIECWRDGFIISIAPPKPEKDMVLL